MSEWALDDGSQAAGQGQGGEDPTNGSSMNPEGFSFAEHVYDKSGGAQGPGGDQLEGGGEESAASGRGPQDAGKGPILPEHLGWVKDPEKLSGFLMDFNKKYPLNPSTAPKAVKDVYENMKPPSSNYGPPKGSDKDAAEYWARYFGFPDQYAANKVSVESKGKADAWVSGSQAAGLGQVRPNAAYDAGFDFGPRDKYGNLRSQEHVQTFRKAMEDPGFNSMVSSMYSRMSFNVEKGNPFKSEAGYNQGPYGIKRGDAWTETARRYVQEMFPGQWDGSTK
ncbi:hypothetical protein NNJEOMEG_03943 [Fundidesulfovibrio magnetotacticus]|uniref:Uncharacterized protein n=1 Tax=Fundidesulfovibrio magnetotacticus TaxID=2730080 RepID=A0A6V8M1I0_9BACT|nr:hypothetical protein [Fundidesulfovibrio magnetotacticus]GFK96069.1 hypothetical protein NNJEOMEG_03943 [Fundidesulfovibrio magnetotacticus]